MLKRRWCVVYTYKGSSNDWRVTESNRFFQSEFDMGEFFEKINGNPGQYELKNVYRCSFERMTLEDIIWHRESHAGEKALRKERAELAISSATEKLHRLLTPTEIGILKNEKII